MLFNIIFFIEFFFRGCTRSENRESQYRANALDEAGKLQPWHADVCRLELRTEEVKSGGDPWFQARGGLPLTCRGPQLFLGAARAFGAHVLQGRNPRPFCRSMYQQSR